MSAAARGAAGYLAIRQRNLRTQRDAERAAEDLRRERERQEKRISTAPKGARR